MYKHLFLGNRDIVKLLYRHECFTGKYATRKTHKNNRPGPEWFIFHNLTREFIDNVIQYLLNRCARLQKYCFTTLK